MIQNKTPVEKIQCFNTSIYIKREDLACSPPGPPFAKVRGLFEVLTRLKSEGVQTVGYVETSISMAGWGVSWMTKELELKSVIFCPKYKKEGINRDELFIHHEKWVSFGSDIVYQKAGRSSVNYHLASRWMKENLKERWKLLPLGLRFRETVDQVAKELCTIDKNLLNGTIVVCVGSGMMLSGILKGLLELGLNPSVYGIQCYAGSLGNKRKRIERFSDSKKGFFSKAISFELVPSEYEYSTPAKTKVPFPCNKFYDAKAWEWLVKNVSKLKEPILFWNIGG